VLRGDGVGVTVRQAIRGELVESEELRVESEEPDSSMAPWAVNLLSATRDGVPCYECDADPGDAAPGLGVIQAGDIDKRSLGSRPPCARVKLCAGMTKGSDLFNKSIARWSNGIHQIHCWVSQQRHPTGRSAKWSHGGE
jgi:hypothetical protein